MRNKLQDILEQGEKEFEEKFIQKAEQSYKSAVADQVAPYRHQLETLLEVKEYMSSQQHKLLQSIVEMIDIAKEEMKAEVEIGQWVGNWQNTPLINESDVYKVLDRLKEKLQQKWQS